MPAQLPASPFHPQAHFNKWMRQIIPVDSENVPSRLQCQVRATKALLPLVPAPNPHCPANSGERRGKNKKIQPEHSHTRTRVTPSPLHLQLLGQNTANGSQIAKRNYISFRPSMYASVNDPPSSPNPSSRLHGSRAEMALDRCDPNASESTRCREPDGITLHCLQV